MTAWVTGPRPGVIRGSHRGGVRAGPGVALAAVVIVALAARLAVVLMRDAPVGEEERRFPDTFEYWSVSTSIREARGFGIGGQVQHGRPPGYPLFLVLARGLAGDDRRAVLVLQAIVSAGTVLPLWALARRLTGSPAAALLSGALLALDPLSAYCSALLLSETLYTFWLVAGLERLARGLDAMREGPTGAFTPLAWAGVLLAIAALTRAQALALGILLAPLVTLAPSVQGRGRALAAYLCAFVLTLAPWCLRNLRVYEGFVPIAIGEGILLYESNNPHFALVPWPEGVPRPLTPPGATPQEMDREYRQRALEHMAAHLGEVLAHAPRKLARMFALTPSAPGHRGVEWAMALALTTIPIYVLATAGLLIVPWRAAAPVLVTIAFSAALHTVFLGSIRYRVPLMPLIFVLASAGAVALAARLRPAR